MSDKVILNEKEISQEEFEEQKKELEKKKGVRVVEISPGVYKIRIRG